MNKKRQKNSIGQWKDLKNLNIKTGPEKKKPRDRPTCCFWTCCFWTCCFWTRPLGMTDGLQIQLVEAVLTRLLDLHS